MPSLNAIYKYWRLRDSRDQKLSVKHCEELRSA
jgi:hypothetical protein